MKLTQSGNFYSTWAFRLAVTCCFAAAIGYTVRWNLLYEAITRAKIHFFIVSTLFGVVNIIILACKYSALIHGSKLHVTLGRMISINFISIFYSFFLPSSFAQTGVRWHKATNSTDSRAFFLAVSLFERASQMLIVLVFAALALYFSQPKELYGLPYLLVVAIIALLGINLCFLPGPLRSLLSHQTRTLTKNTWGQRIQAGFSDFSPSTSQIGTTYALAALGHCCFALRYFFIFLSLGLPLSFIDAMVMTSLLTALLVLPISIAGVGLREGGLALLFIMFGLGQELGVAAGLLFLVQMLAFAGLGMVAENLDR